jgi:hypothetical protein
MIVHISVVLCKRGFSLKTTQSGEEKTTLDVYTVMYLTQQYITSRVPAVLLWRNSTSAYISYQSFLPEKLS